MDAGQHSRFLSYLELAKYFVRKGTVALDAQSFAACDAEFTQLLERERRGAASREDAQRLVQLRRMLLRD
ncbi:MAG: hypothetical protein R3A78_15475 [Polyangiales bacterium]|nr:hypothetical protein [Myxococcales bacterium]